MKIIEFILCALITCYSDEVPRYMDGIQELTAQIYTWIYPENSESYKSYDPNVAIYDGHFDFIICGAGAAGSLVASKLAQTPLWNVLLLEVGDSENDITNIPRMARPLKTSSYNWGYFTEPQANGFEGIINESVAVTSGKALGGTSVLDTMTFIRGNEEDYNTWGESNPGWNYSEVLPTFKNIEKVQFPNPDTNYRGTDGDIPIDYSRVFNDIGQTFLDSFVELDKPILDHNGQFQLGASRLQLIQDQGKRVTSAYIYLKSILRLPNFQIFFNSLVTKVIIDKNLNKTIGVQYVRNGVLHNATVSKEVILTMGPINTPQTLMLSGIGPANHLEENDVTVINNLPVGYNLWDHLIYSFQVFKTNQNIQTFDLKTEVSKYLNNGTGSLTSPYGYQATGFSKVTVGGSNVPDVQYLLRAGVEPIENYTAYKNLDRYTEDTYNNVILPHLGIPAFTLDIVSLHPGSRGRILLQSNSSFDFPKIDPNYFSNASDVQVFVKAIRETFEIANTTAFKKYNSTLIPVVHPMCATYTYDTDAFWECMVKTVSKSNHAMGGTAKMGPSTDPTAVVNHDLKVHGIENLRVADSSVIPTTISGGTNAATYLIAERAADLIISKYRYIDY